MQLSTNTRAFVEAEQYSDFILSVLHDGLLPETWYRNVSDFGSGDTLHIKTVGSVTLQEAAEDQPLDYSPIETGEIQLSITEYVGDAWYVSDDLREDGTSIDRLMADRAVESVRSFQEKFETDFLKTGALVYAGTTSPFNVNSQPHLIVSAESSNKFTLNHLITMSVSFNKANAPQMGRIFVCDPIVAGTINKLVQITNDVTPFGQRIIESGMSSGMNFIMNLNGWDIVTSNRLYVGNANDGTTSISGGVFNMCMCILDDQTKPVMGVLRRPLKTEGERNKDLRRDEFVATSRYGWGVQRLDTMGAVVTSATAY